MVDEDCEERRGEVERAKLKVEREVWTARREGIGGHE